MHEPFAHRAPAILPHPRHRALLASLLLTLATLLGPAVHAQADDWELRKRDEERGIDIYLRRTQDGFGEFRGTTTVTSRLSAFVALFRDVANMPEWMDGTASVETLRIDSLTEDVSYTIIDMPWPLKQRDTVLRTVLQQDEDSLALTLRTTGEPHFLPEHEDYIRMPLLESLWRFTPMGAGRVAVEFHGRAELGGRLSGGMMKRLQARLLWRSPHRTLTNLPVWIAMPEYQSASYDFITEPVD